MCKKLHTAFPIARRHRGLVHGRLKAIQLLRNRISHHEPFLKVANALYTGDGVITLPEVLECDFSAKCAAFHALDERIYHSLRIAEALVDGKVQSRADLQGPKLSNTVASGTRRRSRNATTRGQLNLLSAYSHVACLFRLP
jgi:hypothetical protein